MTHAEGQPFDLVDYATSNYPFGTSIRSGVDGLTYPIMDTAEGAARTEVWLGDLRENLREPHDQGKVNIIIVGTGGTFQSAPGPDGYEPTGDLRTSFDALGLPKDDTVHLELVDLMNADSSQMTVDHWSYLASIITRAEYTAGDLYDAIIVTHGTDTMALGASYLSFMLQGFPKSIVFTGSQHPALMSGGDAKDQMERALTTAKLSANQNRRITEVMVACGLKVTRGTWAAKLGDQTTDAFGPWNQPTQPLDASDWERAAADGSIERHAPALLDLGTGKSRGALEFARHALEYRKKGPFRPFTCLMRQSGIVPVRMTDMNPRDLARLLVTGDMNVLTLLGSATADDKLVDVATTGADHGKLIVVKAPFPDSILKPGVYKAGSGIARKIAEINRPLPRINTSPDALAAKMNFVRSQQGIKASEGGRGIGPVYTPEELRAYYDAIESNLVGELV